MRRVLRSLAARIAVAAVAALAVVAGSAGVVRADDPVQGWNFNTWYVRAWTALPASGADGDHAVQYAIGGYVDSDGTAEVDLNAAEFTWSAEGWANTRNLQAVQAGSAVVDRSLRSAVLNLDDAAWAEWTDDGLVPSGGSVDLSLRLVADGPSWPTREASWTWWPGGRSRMVQSERVQQASGSAFVDDEPVELAGAVLIHRRLQVADAVGVPSGNHLDKARTAARSGPVVRDEQVWAAGDGDWLVAERVVVDGVPGPVAVAWGDGLGGGWTGEVDDPGALAVGTDLATASLAAVVAHDGTASTVRATWTAEGAVTRMLGFDRWSDGADRGRSWWATESSGGTAEVTVDAVTSTAAGGIVVTTIAT